MARNSLRHASIEPTHPGEMLDDIVIPATGKTKTAIARMLGVSRPTLYDILSKKQAVTPAMAVRLGKMFGNGAAMWIGMQTAYDLWHAEREVDVSAIPTLKAA